MRNQFFTILFLAVSLQAIGQTEADPFKSMQAVEVASITPMFGPSFYWVFYLGPYIVYKNQYHYSASEMRLVDDSTAEDFATEQKILESGWKNYFFVFHRDSSFGYTYDSNSVEREDRRVLVDSVLRYIRGSNNLEAFLKQKPDSTFWSADQKELKEVFIQHCSDTLPKVQLALYYSSRLNHLPETINTIVDSVKKMKLYKTEIVIADFVSPKNKVFYPSSIMSTVIAAYEPTNKEEIILAVNRYKKSTVVK